MLKCSSVPTLCVLRNSLLGRSPQGWCFRRCWCALRIVLPRPPVRLSLATPIPAPVSLTPYIVWYLKPLAARVFGGTKEASHASL